MSNAQLDSPLHNLLRFIAGVVAFMRYDKWELALRFIASTYIFMLVVRTGNGVSIGMVTIGAITIVDIGALFNAYQLYRQGQQTDSEQTKFR